MADPIGKWNAMQLAAKGKRLKAKWTAGWTGVGVGCLFYVVLESDLMRRRVGGRYTFLPSEAT